MTDTDQAIENRGPHGYFGKGNTAGGRTQSKLTAKRAAKIVALIGAGNFISTAARGAGVAPTTLRHWLARGDRDYHAGRRNTNHAKLYRQVRDAGARNEAELVAAIKEAATTGQKGSRVNRKASPVLGPDGKPQVIRDAQGEPVVIDGRVQYLEHVTTHTEIVREPQYRAARDLLQARHKSRFSPTRKVAVEGQVAHGHAHAMILSPDDREIATRIAANRLIDDNGRNGPRLLPGTAGPLPVANAAEGPHGGQAASSEPTQTGTVQPGPGTPGVGGDELADELAEPDDWPAEPVPVKHPDGQPPLYGGQASQADRVRELYDRADDGAGD